LMASSFCVQPLRSRSFRTCGPTTFSCETGFSMLASYQSHSILVEALPAIQKNVLAFYLRKRLIDAVKIWQRI
jgi:hypothetical protein